MNLMLVLAKSGLTFKTMIDTNAAYWKFQWKETLEDFY